MTFTVHFFLSRRTSAAPFLRHPPRGTVPTRQTSSSGKSKSPRIQVVLPEELCARLAALAESESRTLSNMAKVLIQQGVERLEQLQGPVAPVQAPYPIGPAASADRFRRELEQQEQGGTRRLRGAPRRLRLRQPPLSP
jgi:hypothetical protein